MNPIEAIDYKIEEADHDIERAIEKKDKDYEIFYRGKKKAFLEAKSILGSYIFIWGELIYEKR